MTKARTALSVVFVLLILAVGGTITYLWANNQLEETIEKVVEEVKEVSKPGYEEGQSITMEGYIRVAEKGASGNVPCLELVAKDTDEVFRISCEDESKARELGDHIGKLVEIKGTLRQADKHLQDSGAPAWFLDKVDYQIKELAPPAEEELAPPAEEELAPPAEKTPADEEQPFADEEREETSRVELQGGFRIAEFDKDGNVSRIDFAEKNTGKIYNVVNDENQEKYVGLIGKPVLVTGELKTDETGNQWLHVLEYQMAEQETPGLPEKEGEK